MLLTYDQIRSCSDLAALKVLRSKLRLQITCRGQKGTKAQNKFEACQARIRELESNA